MPFDALSAVITAQNMYGARFKPYGRVITLAGASDTLTNFPALIKLTNDAALQAHAAADGSDVYFTVGGVEVAKELDWYDGTTGSGAWWVQIPSISTAGATVVMHYGAGAEKADDKASLWSSYRAVYHYTSTEKLLEDATGSYPLTLSGTMPTYTQITTSPTGRCLQSRCTSDASLNNTSAYSSGGTLSVYGYAPSTINGSHIFYGCGYGHISQDGGTLKFCVNGNGSLAATLSPPRQFGFICASTYQAGGNANSFGCYDGTVNSYSPHGYINSGSMICYSTWNWAPGIVAVDEQRISSIVRSSAWISYEWANIMTNSTVTTYGPEVRI